MTASAPGPTALQLRNCLRAAGALLSPGLIGCMPAEIRARMRVRQEERGQAGPEAAR